MTDPHGNRLDDCGVCTLLPTVTGTVRAEQATCPVHGTPPYAPLSAPSASSQALPADRDTPPDLAVALHLWEAHQMDGNRAAGAPIAMLRDIVTAVRTEVAVQIEVERVKRANTACCGGTGECGDRECQIASAVDSVLADLAERFAAAPSVPTGTRDPADRWWTHGSCGPAPGNADGPRWTSCVGCGKPDLHWTPYPTPGSPVNGDSDAQD